MKVGVVDLGTNSMRLLITDGEIETGRWEEVTGLGRGVDATGALSAEAIQDSLAALARFGSRMDQAEVVRRIAIATSASRDASNRETFFDLAESALGVRPTLISGVREARLAYAGAGSLPGLTDPVVVSDIGGGSTEFVTADSGVSIDIGSVRLTERAIPSRPAPGSEVTAARRLVAALFHEVEIPVGTLVGVAGSWTSVAAIARRNAADHGQPIHGYRMGRSDLAAVIEDLAVRSIEETAAVHSLDPKRASVILAGALVAEGVMGALGVEETFISERDTLDGAAMELLALP